MKYTAFQVSETENGFSGNIELLDTENLLVGNVLIKVVYSSLNYKDALSATGNKGVTKNYPHTPGIDAAGIVVESLVDRFKTGDEVIVTGFDLGMNTPGGFAEYIRVPAEWIEKLPEGLSLKESMILGTAGFTAAVSVMRLAEIVKPEDGKIVITGASGGVGSIALSILSKLGYQTVAISGKEQEFEFLKSLGANEIIHRKEWTELPEKPILTARFAGAIDTVGGDILVKVIKSIHQNGAVTTCGSVASVSLNNMSVFPFILRAVTLIGISAQNYPASQRGMVWNNLAGPYKIESLLNIYQEITLSELSDTIQLILIGKIKGRTIIKI
jgi:putative YhdH/YhfP family quinone oxidoreductase